ncbi:hypothetical protein MYCTH_2302980 [Thermothelomyces thermophilus ATCC 42464]|uniref:Nucleoside phosphorylase domain-containing protein n=1 Tax=Thermothelomyces thermophilus (strain ATCC 42464 / BCRC 31852 / DSM 1799) TaxID=573729 RepID=G2Q902_THET4|nr:uncharacterized protein MYCTH_2302980 [Thermothelomyces thermophilus ATCC 42464]AEO57146.1 hypothetical protein MYCTH_2302980 [Thermothelomyces thermophilus ATCC 42464]
MGYKRPESCEEFHVAIVCALPLEFNAVLSVLDQTWDDDGLELRKSAGDLNQYVNGRIGKHNVVLTLLPDRMGKVNAAVVASDLRHSYPNLRLTLLVGICGGVPMAGNDEVVLGDVVISRSLVQYDFGRQYPDGFRRKDSSKDNLAKPNHEILAILAMLDTDRKELLSQKTVSFLQDLQQRKPRYAFPRASPDRLFRSEYRHKHRGSPECECRNRASETDPVCEEAMGKSCEEVGCEDSFLVRRRRVEQREGPEPPPAAFHPAIHIGPVGSGDTVMKSGVGRDKIAEQEGIIAFEMEAAGIWEHLSCLVVKGVCDYADSHKNKKWQDYAAATAASTAKAILTLYTPAVTTTAVAHRRRLTPKWAVPFPPDPDFVDRPDISAWLQEKSRLPGARVALVGLGGIGKSQLAIQYAYHVRKDSHVFWLNATSRSTLEESYRAIARRLGLGLEAHKESKDDDITYLVSDWLGDEENGRWTVVLDNFDDYSILGDDDPRFLRLLPQTSNGFTLITSRTSHAAEKLVGNPKNVYQVAAMTEDVALKLLQTKLKDGCGDEEGREAVRLLDCLPLAISQAAAYINRRSPRVRVEEYVDMLRSKDGQEVLLGWEYDDGRRYGGASTSVLGTWTFTLEQIRKERPSAADLLSLMSFFNPQSIPDWALRAWFELDPGQLPSLTLRDTLSEHASTFLSSISPKRRREMHRLVPQDQAVQIWSRWVSADLTKGGKPASTKETPTGPWKPRFSDLTKAVAKDWWPSKSGSSRGGDGDNNTTSDAAVAGEQFEQDLDTLVGYSLAMPTASKGVFKMHPLIRYCTQTWLARTKSFDTWKRRFLLAAVMRIDSFKAHGRIQPGLAAHFNPLAEEEPRDMLEAKLWFYLAWAVYHSWKEIGARSLATTLLDKLVAIATKFFWPVDISTVMVMDERARVYSKNGEYDMAEKTWKEISRLSEKYAGDHYVPAVQDSRLACARMLLARGRAAEAEEIVRDIVDFRVRVYGPQLEETLASLGTHTEVLTALGKFQEAGSIIRDLLRQDWTGKDSFLHSYTINIIAFTVLEMGKAPAKQVEDLLRELTDFVEHDPRSCTWFPFTLSGPIHEAFIRCLWKQGKKDEARSVRIRGTELMARLITVPQLHPPTLVDSLLDDGDGDGDVESRGRLLQGIIENLYREDVKPDDNFYWGIGNIGRRLYLQGRYEEAGKLLEAIVAHMTSNPAYGGTHTMTSRMRILWNSVVDDEESGDPPADTDGGEGEELHDINKEQSRSSDSSTETLVEASPG